MSSRSSRHEPPTKDLYLIGEVSRLGGISQRALRHYDSLKLIEPDYIGDNNYRYYSLMTILRIPVINYLKKMGFSLEDISQIFESDDYKSIRSKFKEYSDECEQQISELTERREIIHDWSDLIEEASIIKAAGDQTPTVKFLPAQSFLCMPYEFWGNYADATVNLEFTAFVDSVNNVISGPVMMRQPDWHACLEPFAADKNEGIAAQPSSKHTAPAPREVLVLQKALRPIDPEHGFVRDAGMFLSLYHTGSFETLYQSYQKLADFASAHSLVPQGPAYERFVTDYWTSYDADLFVTEILLPLEQT